MMGFLERLSSPTMTPEQASAALAAGQLVVLDVREDDEYRAGRIAGARHLPLTRLESDTLTNDERYLAVCRSGMRSGQATRALRRAGFDVTNLRGGMMAWERAGFPIQTTRIGKR